jgi:hypothetical protein
MKLELNEKESLNRPAWTSETSTGNLTSFNHKHTVYQGHFVLVDDHYKKTNGKAVASSR